MLEALSDLPGGGVAVRAPAKLNLYLEVLGLRPDGYHEIDTVMQEISLCDEIQFRPRPGAGIRIEVAGGGRGVPASDDNLVARAAWLLAGKDPGRLLVREGLDVRLDKRVPVGAGLGGGSSDAASTLIALSRLWGLSLSREELSALAARVGSDAAFFIHGGTARCQGRGERVTPLRADPVGEPFHYVLVYPDIEVPTAFIYKELDRLDPPRAALTRKSRLDTMTEPAIWKGLREGELAYNRLQPIACQAFPELELCLKEIKREPFIATMMSGSGSTIFGLCESRKEAARIAARLEGRIRGRVFTVQSEPGQSDPGQSDAVQSEPGLD